MKSKSLNTILSGLVLSASCLVNVANAGIITLDSTLNLNDALADTKSNFHPQGLGFDTATNELLFFQQSSNTIYNTDLAGNIQGSLNVSLNHSTSVAGDGGNYYATDYTGNSGGTDIFSVNKATGVTQSITSETAAYGGYPIDVRNGVIYRTNNSSGYNWGNLNQILISSISSVDAISQTVSLTGSNGIGDIAVDYVNNQIWTIDYSANALLRQFDLTTGTELASYNFGLDGLTAGLTYANDKLYYYDWNSGSGSTLSRFSLNSTDVPEPSTLAIFALGLFGLAARRNKKS
jgi:hypothetical protein